MKSFIQLINEKKADRIKNATGGKKTGSFSKGNLSFPGDRSGAYKSTKIDIEVKKGLKDAGASGDFSPTMPPEVRAKAQAKRDARIKKLATPDPFDPNYDKKTGNIDGRSKTGKVFKSTKPVTTSSPGFGKGDTPGQIRVKGLEKKSFKVTQPKDVKLPKSFTNFGKKLQDFKDRDLPGGPRKTTTKPKTSSPSLTRQDVGMAPPDKPKVVKQSEVSKQIKKTNNFSKFRQEAEAAKNKYRADVQKTFDNKSLKGKQKSKKTRVDMVKVKKAAELEKGYKLASQGKGNLTSGIVKSSNLDVVKSANKTTKKPVSLTKSKTGSEVFNQNKFKGATGPKSMKDVKLPKVPSNVMQQMKGLDKGYTRGYTGSFSSFRRRVQDNLAVQDISKKPIKTTGGKLVTAGQMKDTAIVKDAAKPKKITIGTPIRSPASKMTKYPKIGKYFDSSWATRGYGKQAGALFGVNTGINKYKQEIKKGKSKVSAATSATLKGGSSGLGSYAGAIIGRKLLGKPGMMVGSAIGSSLGERGYEVANNLKNVTTKQFKKFRKKSPNNIKKSNPSSKGLPKFSLSSD